MKRRTYLAMKTLEEAREVLFSRFGPEERTDPEDVSVEDALGRVTAQPVFADRSVPSFHSAAMDGIAVRAENTYGTNERNPKTLKIGRDAVWINTGQPMPEGLDAVIMVEKLYEAGDDCVEIRAAAHPWQNVRKVGEDIVATQLILPQNHRISPYDIGALVSAGLSLVSVWERPRVAIIPTGSELLDYKDVKKGERLRAGHIIEYNSLVLAGLVRECNAIPLVHDIVPDVEEEIRSALKQAVDSDAHVVVINAGSSAGSKDYTIQVIEEVGEVLVHGVTMMPGKPTILALVGGKPVIGNPGYAVSSSLSFGQFVRPLLYRLQGTSPPQPETVKVKPARDIPSKLGMEEFLRVNIGKVGERYVATPLPRGAGSITTLTRAEGIVRIPALSEGISQNEEAVAELLVDPGELLNTLVFIGSHDMTLDIASDEIRSRSGEIRISMGNVGSLGGLIALRKGICHISGSHLLDAETGEYNISYVRRYLKGMAVSIYHLVLREQGLIVAKGNPKGIQGVEDLMREDVVFLNRQPGSGTRVLLDYKLRERGLDSQGIYGYNHEEYTHMAVAVGVLSGAADCGMGIFAAAKALDLDFVPVEREQYDLIIPSRYLDHALIQALLDTVGSERFRERVNALGGYDASRSGQFWTEVK